MRFKPEKNFLLWYELKTCYNKQNLKKQNLQKIHFEHIILCTEAVRIR